MSRPKGTLNKATIQKRELAANIAAREVADARFEGKKLAKERLAEMLDMFIGMAAVFQPDNPRQVAVDPSKSNPHADEERFLTYIREAKQVAIALAPYQSPTFRAIAISTDRSPDSFGTDGAEPVRYKTAAEIASDIARRGLPPLRTIIESQVLEEIIDEPLVVEHSE